MHVSKLSILLTATIILTASQSIAETGSGEFAGPYLSLGAGYQTNKIFQESVHTATGSTEFDQPDSADTHPVGQLQAGYGINLGERFNLSANVFYNFSNERAGHLAATFFQDDTKQKLENNMGISIEPGFYINNKTLSFVKLGYARADERYVRPAHNVSLTNSINGFLYGVGGKYMVTKHIFLGADLTRYQYGSTEKAAVLTSIPVIVTSKVDQTVGLVSVGYKF